MKYGVVKLKKREFEFITNVSETLRDLRALYAARFPEINTTFGCAVKSVLKEFVRTK